MHSRVLLIFFLLCSMPDWSCVATAATDKPNVIFILCDDLGWGDLGVFYQNESKHDRTHRTPGLDQMAAQGMQLRAHYCPAPVCAPSRSSLLTGVHQGHASVRDNQFDKMLIDNHTLGTVMQAAGYRTAMIGKYGLQGNGDSGSTWTSFPTKRGFDEFYGYVRHGDGHLHYPADKWLLGNSTGHRSPKQVWHNHDEVSAGLQKCYTTDLFTARSKYWINKHVQSQPNTPFFLYLAYDTPHAALQVPSVAYPEGKGLHGGVQWIGERGKMINTAVGEIDSYRHPDYVGHGWTDVEERFATMVRRIDNGVADLLQTLRDLGIAESTMVVLTSDNGPHHESYLAGQQYDPTSFQSYGPFEGTKRDTWEGGIRMPTLVWWPGHVPANQINQQPSQFHDWMPTFAALAGTVAPARSDGVSLVPSLTGKPGQRPSTIYVEYWNRGTTREYADFAASRRRQRRYQMQVIHLDGYKGIRTDIQSHSDPFAIYDLANDPRERHNLADTTPEFRQLQRRMQDRVLQLRRPNPTAARPYDKEFVPAVQANRLKPGLRWSAYEGDFHWVPQTGDLQPVTEGTCDQPVKQQAGTNAVEFAGFVKVPRDDTYTFVLRTGTRAFLRIHDASVVDADFRYDGNQPRAGSIRLAKGLHPIRITCLADDAGNADPGLRWAASGTAPREFQTDQLFYDAVESVAK